MSCLTMAKAVAKSRKPQRNQSHLPGPQGRAPRGLGARTALSKKPGQAGCRRQLPKSRLPLKPAVATQRPPDASRERNSAVKAGKWVYTFGDGKAEGKAGLRDLLGGKGANLAEMANLGLPVPPGFTIPTSVCTYFYAHDKILSDGIEGAGREGAGSCRQADRQGVRRFRESAAGFGPLRRRAPRCRA